MSSDEICVVSRSLTGHVTHAVVGDLSKVRVLHVTVGTSIRHQKKLRYGNDVGKTIWRSRMLFGRTRPLLPCFGNTYRVRQGFSALEIEI